MRLTEHFRSQEFDCHDGTRVPDYAIDDLRWLCVRYLEPLRHQFGPVFVVSGYRHWRYNQQVGGAPRSWHIYLADRAGAAADVRCRRGSAAAWYAFLLKRNPGGLGRYSDHVHVDNRKGTARW